MLMEDSLLFPTPRQEKDSGQSQLRLEVTNTSKSPTAKGRRWLRGRQKVASRKKVASCSQLASSPQE